MRPLAGVICVLSGAVAGCVVYDPQLVDRDVGPACELTRPPARPSIPDPGGGPEVAFGLREVLLDQGDMALSTGYDLDGICTVRPSFGTECTRGGPSREDGEGGLDNVFGESLYPLVEARVMGLEAMARRAQDEGRGLPVIRIRNWDGSRNDPQVQIAIMQAVFGTSAEAMGGGPPAVNIISPVTQTLSDGSPVPFPVWDGEDYLWVRTDAFLGGDIEQPFIVDDAAYVVDGVVVARLPDQVDIIFPTDDIGVLVRLTQAVATGVLSADGTELNPVFVTGRWRIVDLLSTAENIGICMGQPDYNLLAGTLDRIADVRSMPPRPGDPPSPCDAISLGVSFRGTRARIVSVTPGLPLFDLCATGGDAGIGVDAGPVDAGFDAGEIDSGSPLDAGLDAPTDTGPDVPG